MGDINKVIIRGRAAASAEWKDLPNTTLVTLRVATSDDYTDRDGRKVERTDWHMLLPEPVPCVSADAAWFAMDDMVTKYVRRIGAGG